VFLNRNGSRNDGRPNFADRTRIYSKYKGLSMKWAGYCEWNAEPDGRLDVQV